MAEPKLTKSLLLTLKEAAEWPGRVYCFRPANSARLVEMGLASRATAGTGARGIVVNEAGLAALKSAKEAP